jgi:hypothetical protein
MVAAQPTCPAPVAVAAAGHSDASGLGLDQYPDTQRFLQVLETLDEPLADGLADRPDRKAARGLFRWEVRNAGLLSAG